MNLSTFAKNLPKLTEYPLEDWHPTHCGTLPIRIDRDGQWWYQESPFTRPELVCLFAALLHVRDGRYLLTTPVEEVQISVDDAPFVAVDLTWQGTAGQSQLCLIGNLQQRWWVSSSQPVVLKADPATGQRLPYLQLPRGLSAKLSRNVFYQLAEFAHSVSTPTGDQYVVQSADYQFQLG